MQIVFETNNILFIKVSPSLAKDYQKMINDKGHIIITVDGYTFTPDLQFMNGHAVCSYCGAINCWEYSFPNRK